MNGVEHYKEIFERYGGMMRTNQLEKENILYCKIQQLCSDQPHATFTLRQTESALHFHTLALIPIVLSLVSGFTLLRLSRSWAGKAKTFLPGSIWTGEDSYKRS